MSQDIDTSELVRLPSWLHRPPGSATATRGIKSMLRSAALNTVCEEARCPNIAECFGRGTATFMILGDVCTRGCRFCSITTGAPVLPEAAFAAEGERVAESTATLGLRYVVVTSVARDDLSDGGASGFVKTIEAIRKKCPGMRIEILIPDFRGDWSALEKVLDAGPDVLNHNLETVPRLYRRVRPGTRYTRSLELLQHAHEYAPHIPTKTGIMLGLGEHPEEVERLMKDAREHFVSIFTAGQYMRPTKRHLPVHEYITPEQFAAYESFAREIGFRALAIGPLVRSSYRADELVSDLDFDAFGSS